MRLGNAAILTASLLIAAAGCSGKAARPQATGKPSAATDVGGAAMRGYEQKLVTAACPLGTGSVVAVLEQEKAMFRFEFRGAGGAAPVALTSFEYNAATGGRIELRARRDLSVAVFDSKMGSQAWLAEVVELVWDEAAKTAKAGRRESWEFPLDDARMPPPAAGATKVDDLVSP